MQPLGHLMRFWAKKKISRVRPDAVNYLSTWPSEKRKSILVASRGFWLEERVKEEQIKEDRTRSSVTHWLADPVDAWNRHNHRPSRSIKH
jgi:hypothetical protein